MITDADRASFDDYGNVSRALEPYTRAASTGVAEEAFRTLFYPHARIVGDSGDLTLNEFIDRVNRGGGAATALTVAVDITGPAASVKLEFQNRKGSRVTDFLLLYKMGDRWRVSGKVYGKKSIWDDVFQDKFADHAALDAAIQVFVEGAKLGDGDFLRTAFNQNAHTIGSIDGDYHDHDLDDFNIAVNDAGPAPDIRHHVASIDIAGDAALAKVELLDWRGCRFTDYFLFYKQTNGHWQISASVYSAHSRDT
ncbi:hypothetical protein CTAYLR_009301 [Chrysophaeum taylorii]|uniref:Lumazine-binding protein n=1 Tax=Chrysophaeum taylorii TaxID=2483200 RepID=A0AAD7ULH2_9STRA|nr:hypothetical protein CTAYLR_009301 [Chrysophaeum taylorii]